MEDAEPLEGEEYIIGHEQAQEGVVYADLDRLRDEFAMVAMGELISGMSETERKETLDGSRGGRRISEAAFMFANAMLLARAKGAGE